LASVPIDRREAFERLVMPQVKVLLRVARSLTGDDTAAENLVRETLLRAFEAMDQFDGAHPRAWLFATMQELHLHPVGAHQSSTFDRGLAEVDLSGSHLGGTSIGIPTETLALRQLVANELSALPERLSRVIGAVDMDGLSYDDASTALGISVHTVMSRLHRARRKIRSRLASDGLLTRGMSGSEALSVARRSPKQAVVCRQVGWMLQRYIDHELDEKASVRASEHVATCSRCGAEFDIYSRIKEALVGITGHDAQHPPDGPGVERLLRFGRSLTITQSF
jgi:RNA polymerase sigma-70 factor, ECF subfamily